MRILWHLWRDITDANAGGAEVYEHEVLQRLGARGHDITLVVGGSPDLATDGPARTYRVVRNGGTFTQYLQSPLTRRRVVARHGEPDVIVDSCNGMAFFSPLVCRTPTVALVHHVHVEQWRDYFGTPIAQVGRFLEQRVMPRVYARSPVVAVSESTADDLANLGLDRSGISIVTAGAHLPETLASEYPDPSFLALGRLVPNKRLHLLLDIWESDVHPRIGGVLRLAGQGPMHQELVDRNVDGVEILGRIDEERKQELLARSWCLVHAAKHEGWGLVINEAAAASRPTLGFNVPGVRDAVIDGETGLLADDPSGFAKFWLELAQNRSIRTELGVGARARARHLSWDETANQIEAVLQAAANV